MPYNYPTDILDQTQTVVDAWRQIAAIPAVGDLTPTNVEEVLSRARALQSTLNGLETQLTDLRNQRDAQNAELWSKIKRIRAGIKGIYGDDSSEYQMVGGTRLSERKRPTRRAPNSTP